MAGHAFAQRIGRDSAQSSIVSITVQERPRWPGPVAMGNLYLNTHVSTVMEREQLATIELWKKPEISEGIFSIPYVTVSIT